MGNRKNCINNTKSVSTGFSPFYMNYGFHPNFSALSLDTSSEIKVPVVEVYFKRIQSAIELAKRKIEQAQSTQKYYADQNRKVHNFKVGDKVFVDTSHFRKQSGVSKLNPLNAAPFKIIDWLVSKRDLQNEAILNVR